MYDEEMSEFFKAKNLQYVNLPKNSDVLIYNTFLIKSNKNVLNFTNHSNKNKNRNGSFTSHFIIFFIG